MRILAEFKPEKASPTNPLGHIVERESSLKLKQGCDKLKNAMYGASRGCGCARTMPSECEETLPVFAFVPVQQLSSVYEVEHGFCRGTIFPELDKPFLAGGCAR